MQVFLSHRENEEGKKYALALREELAILGVDTIIASHLIHPGADWAQKLLEHLEASSALLCIASRGYTDSAWCQQEIGWAIGRNIPALWIRYDSAEHSTGFLKSKQELVPSEPLDEAEIARAIGAWLAAEDKTREETRATLLRALTFSNTYQQTQDIAHVLATLDSWTDDEWKQIDDAAENNRQVREAFFYSGRKKSASLVTVTKWLRRELNKPAKTEWSRNLPVAVLQRRRRGPRQPTRPPMNSDETTSSDSRGSTR